MTRIFPKTSKLFNEFVENTLVKNGPANPISAITLPIGFPAGFEAGEINPKTGVWPKLDRVVHVTNFMTQNEVTVSSGWSARELFEEFIQGSFNPVLDSKGQVSTFYISETGAVMVKKRRQEGQSHVLTVLRGMGTVQEESARLAQLGIDFSYPKPTTLLKYLIQVGAETDSIVLDFFAGAGGTAEAVLELNRLDGGNRHFLMVQLPEPIKGNEFANIAVIGKERVRRVIRRMEKKRLERLPLQDRAREEDLGCKIFRLAKPNIQQWTPDSERDPDTYTEKLALFNDPLLPDWRPENVIWEVALREGFSLNTRFTARELANGNKVYDVLDPDTGQKFIICLDDKIRADLSKHCELTLDALFICRDIALDDSAAANLALQCRLKTI